MSTPKFLRNPKTGVRYRYSAHLAKRNPKLVPCDGPGAEPAFEQVDVEVKATHKPVSAAPVIADVGTGDGTAPELDSSAGGDAQGDAGSETETQAGAEQLMVGEVPLAEASKDQMVDFALAAFGEKLDKRAGEETIRKKLAALLEEQE